MKTCFIKFLFLCILTSGMNAHAAFEPPTESDLGKLLANPDLINVTIKGANGAEAAGVVLRIIDRLSRADLNETQLKYLVALYSSRTAFLLQTTEVEAYAKELSENAPLNLLPTIMGALSIGAGGVPGFGDYLIELAGDDAEIIQAIRNPSLPLTPPVYNLLISALGTTQALPPVIVDSLPPPIPVGEEEGTPSSPEAPPIAEGYAGQTGG